MSEREDLAEELRALAEAAHMPRNDDDALRRAAELLTQPCPHVVSSDEGTQHCDLADTAVTYDWGTYAGRHYLDIDGITVAIVGDTLRDANLARQYQSDRWTIDMIKDVGSRKPRAKDAPPLRWTTEPPTEPGWYWYRKQGYTQGRVVGLSWWDEGEPDAALLPFSGPPDVSMNSGEWAGPIPEPSE